MDAPPITLNIASFHFVFFYLETFYFVYVIVNGDFSQFRLIPCTMKLFIGVIFLKNTLEGKYYEF